MSELQLGSMLGVATATVNITASAAQLQATAIEVISNIIQNLTMAAARNELVYKADCIYTCIIVYCIP